MSLFSQKDNFKIGQNENTEHKWPTCYSWKTRKYSEIKKIKKERDRKIEERNSSVFVRESKENIYD
jgi:hypothetical protein